MSVLGKAREIQGVNAPSKELTQRITNMIDWQFSIIVILSDLTSPDQHRYAREHQLLISNQDNKRRKSTGGGLLG